MTRKGIFGKASLVAVLAAILLAGCQTAGKPRMRIGSFFGDAAGLTFVDPNHLGPHSRRHNFHEKSGLLYTCGAGFIDLGHLREAADRTEYLARITYQNLLQQDQSFSYRLIEPARYEVKVIYPPGWASLSQLEKERIASEAAIIFGQYGAHTSLIWHEILTWYGFASSGIFSENISSFSWEDPYSDVLGTHLAVEAMRNPAPYEEAMTRLISQKLAQLDVQPISVAQEAARKVAGRWYTGGYYFFVEMKRRNFDVGFDDDLLTPWLVPEMCPDAVPQPCPRPTLEPLAAWGFCFELALYPAEFEKTKIFKALGRKKAVIYPLEDFPLLIEHIRAEAQKTYGPQIDCPVF
ncbi:MAG TPA: DUF4056 domain-containing protein [Anaerohalosphaeraceae bacterium]|nr:DUF4056 domain-containing protein [Anaerohalosphaeraceae bacterium]HOL32390.1 DUF4056 domain-containing protein [Anaerohalosphaeraceae bacterium]HOM75833.1 DUF4056 domain-containing protein [Anaerohalosphaeraceae bacterium]HPC64109.1 DUF4056 domain-containing protein [Anaerohalosphaeraceae bacterium]HPO70531.1 DUF4056 domain-containing protein [Anaerohalosphaeraceae bacterium]